MMLPTTSTERSPRNALTAASMAASCHVLGLSRDTLPNYLHRRLLHSQGLCRTAKVA